MKAFESLPCHTALTVLFWIVASASLPTANALVVPRSGIMMYSTSVGGGPCPQKMASVEDDLLDIANTTDADGPPPEARYSMTKINNIQVLTTTNNKKITRPVTFFTDQDDNYDDKDTANSHVDDKQNGILSMLQYQQKELSSSLGALKRSLNEEQTKSQTLQERLERAERIIAEQREELRRATRTQEEQVKALESRLERAQLELEERLERQHFLEDQQAELQSQVRVQEEQEALAEQVQYLQNELDRATLDSDQTKREVDAVSTEVSAAKNEISTLANKLASAQSKEGNYHGKTKNLQTKLEVARQKLAIKQQALTKTQRELAQAQSKLNLTEKLGGGKDSKGRDGSRPKPSKRDSSGPSLFGGSFLGGGGSAAARASRPAPKPSPSPASAGSRTVPPQKKLLYPVIQNWSINEVTGEVTGTVQNHPEIADGTKIVTSSLSSPRMARANAVVMTKSGSRYQLSTPVKKSAADTARDTARSPPLRKVKPSTPFNSLKTAATPVSNAATSNDEALSNMIPFNLFSGIQNPVTAIGSKSSSVSIKNQQPPQQSQQQGQGVERGPQLEFPLTGEAIGSGKYLLAGKTKRKPSGRSEIATAYRADENGQPTGNPLAIKFSTHTDKIKSEYSNYLKIQQRGLLFSAGDQQSPFVRWLDFMVQAEGSVKYAQYSALIMERGVEDLREYRSRIGTMDADEIKSALQTAAQCIEALHKARLIWTDLKAENFVRMDAGNENNVPVFKGVDLESAIPLRGNPLDYTPEAAPPEFAKAYLKGEAYDFVLDYSYDIWSFGMLAYELVHGNVFFGKKAPAQIVRSLAYDFQPPNLDIIEDEKLQDLVQQCLSLNPRKRPSASWILGHAYFRGGAMRLGGMTKLFGW